MAILGDFWSILYFSIELRASPPGTKSSQTKSNQNQIVSFHSIDFYWLLSSFGPKPMADFWRHHIKKYKIR